jgi:hypothetical protein
VSDAPASFGGVVAGVELQAATKRSIDPWCIFDTLAT